MTHIWSPTLFPREILIFQGVLTKFNFLMKFPHLKKIVDLMKYLKYKHQSIFPLWGRVKLKFRDKGKVLWCSYFKSFIKLTIFSRCGNFSFKKPNIYSKNSSHCQGFLTGLSKNDFGIILQTLENLMKKLDSGWSS